MSKAHELAGQIEPGEKIDAAFRRLVPDYVEPSDFHRWFCHWHSIPEAARDFLEGTKPSDNSESLLPEFAPQNISKNDFYDAVAAHRASPVPAPEPSPVESETEPPTTDA